MSDTKIGYLFVLYLTCLLKQLKENYKTGDITLL